MARVLEAISSAFFVFATFLLWVLAAYLLLDACWQVISAIPGPADPAERILESIGLIIIAFAVVELSRFIAEEEVVHKRELRSPREARRSLTKFITIIIIALSLEALVMVFEANRTDISHAIYPAALFGAAVLALVGLGAYQWLSRQVEQTVRPGADEAEPDVTRAGAEPETKEKPRGALGS